MERTLVVVGAKRIAPQSDGYVLLAEPIADWSALAERLELPAPGRGAFASVSWEGHARGAFSALRKVAERVPEIVCVAASDGEGLEPSGDRGRAWIVRSVVPALFRHFETMGLDDEDDSPWLVTHVLGALMRMHPTAEELEAALATIDASLGHGDATSTRQNLGIADTFVFYTAKQDPERAARASSARPALEGLRRLGDARRWPKEGLEDALRLGLEQAPRRYALAVLQIATRAARDHGRSAQTLRAILSAAAAAPGVKELVARPSPPLDLDLLGAVRSGLGELRLQKIPERELASVEAACAAMLL